MANQLGVKKSKKSKHQNQKAPELPDIEINPMVYASVALATNYQPNKAPYPDQYGAY